MMNAEQHTLTVPTSSTAPPEVSAFVSFGGYDIIALYFSHLRTSHQQGEIKVFFTLMLDIREDCPLIKRVRKNIVSELEVHLI
jgi:hypothetical protein